MGLIGQVFVSHDETVMVLKHSHTHVHMLTRHFIINIYEHYKNEEIESFEKTVNPNLLRQAWYVRKLFSTCV